MEKVRAWCGQPLDRGRLKNRTEQNCEDWNAYATRMTQESCIEGIHIEPAVTRPVKSKQDADSVAGVRTFARPWTYLSPVTVVVRWRSYNFLPPAPANIRYGLTVLIHNSGHFGPPLPFWAPAPLHCRGCRWLDTSLLWFNGEDLD